MLQLSNIIKDYKTGDSYVRALNGISLNFRENEFVSILGPSGCGKTTLLNIIGGLDQYTSGDLVINGVSTKEYRDADWDTYRNHSVGFVFQSYNLIPHQTVLSNVELALTLSGISKKERRARAISALEDVGLGDQIHKKPNQLSGGQMQRVAIARALVNDPDILLADEPTGALDTKTSVQIMEILRSISHKKLIIMVTHNPDLAHEYSSRIISVLDGRVVDDTDPFTPEAEELPVTDAETAGLEKKKAKKAKKERKKKKKSMSFFTALSLSLNNLLTKKTRTVLTSVAGSIGIIGIALILALSNGIQLYIDRVQEDALSAYPLTIQKTTTDYSAMLSAMTEVNSKAPETVDDTKIYVDDSMGSMISALSATVENDLESFKKYLEEHYDEIEDSLSDVQYTYDFDLQVFSEDGKTQVNPTTIFDSMGDMFSGMDDLMSMGSSMGALSIMSEMIDNQELLEQQYELVGEGSEWADEKDEVMLVVGRNNELSKMTLYMLGVLDQGEIEEILQSLMEDGEYESSHMQEYELSDFLGMKFRLLNTSDFYKKFDSDSEVYTVDGKDYPLWYDLRDSDFDGNGQEAFVKENGIELRVAGIIRPKADSTAASISGAIGYTKALTDYILEENTKSEIILQQKETPDNSVLSGGSFERIPYTKENVDQLIKRVGSTNMKRFYTIMTAMVLNNAEYKDLLNIDESNAGMFIATMEDDQLASKVKTLLEMALRGPLPSTMTGMSGAGGAQGGTGLTAAIPSADQSAQDALTQGTIPPTGMTPPTMTITQEMVVNMYLAGLSSEEMQKNDPDGLYSVTFTADNVIDLLPLMSDQQIMMLVGMKTTNPETKEEINLPGLLSFCSEEDKKAFLADMNLAMETWTVNEKSMLMLLDFMDDAQFEKFEETLYDMVPDKDETYDSLLRKLGDAEKASPASINFYAKDFDSKDRLEAFIAEYNDSLEDENKKLEYTDMIGILMSSVSTIIDVISYVLIAFVSISLVVSSIMIGIITYISVLERTKEIGILRAVGASKRDVSRVFNAETLLIGFASGLFGILFTVLLCIPVNAIIHAVAGIDTVSAVLPPLAGVILVLISMFLTFIAGLFPASIAAKRNPVEALRSE